MKITHHQQLDALMAQIKENGGLTYARIKGFRGRFEHKSFILQQLRGLHADICADGIHAPTIKESGGTTSECPYCDYSGSI